MGERAPAAKIDVLGPALHQFAEATVHPRLHQPLGEGKVVLQTMTQVGLRQRQVFGYFLADGGVSSSAFISFSGGQDELSVGNPISRLRSTIDCLWVVPERQ